ncbi:hypothetical protein AGMMS49574_18290 [Bacteroidia bacterium]|nr:hypothetical protein AGMMS49574_18290 [Bacteroidia bacterium]GHU57086.1 hypothetical protein FACS189411_09620 [Bacteroidia bacterium]
MKNRKITIENGIVAIPGEVSMNIAEIANLFDIFYQTAKRNIRLIEKSGVADGNYSQSCSCDRSQLYPDYYGLEMVIALSFRIQSKNAEIFRKYIMNKVSKVDIPVILTIPIQNATLN